MKDPRKKRQFVEGLEEFFNGLLRLTVGASRRADGSEPSLWSRPQRLPARSPMRTVALTRREQLGGFATV